jgi:DNA helicase HerA-like ATPase
MTKLNAFSRKSTKGIPVGRVKAPKGTTGYVFITKDTDLVRIGEFLFYQITDAAGETRNVLGRAISRESIREYPVSYLSLVEISPDQILKATGIDSYSPLFEVEVSIIGYYDRNFKFVNPRLPPLQGTQVYLASDDHLRSVLGRGGREEGSALIGYLLNRPGGRVPISLDVGELVSKHLAVLAATGAGKSYTVGVLLEELMGIYNKAAVLVLDPHGEYSTLDKMRNLRDNPLLDQHYLPEVKVLSENDIRIRYFDLESTDWSGILKDASDKMLNLLHESLGRLKRRGKFSFSDIMSDLDSVRDDSNSSSIDGLNWRLRAHARKKIFSTGEYTPLQEILKPGLLSIIDMSELEEAHQQLIASILLRKILQARIKTKKDKISDGEDFLPYPVFIVLEEAHRFAPSAGESRAKRVLKTILSEGRKFGVGCCLVSQRPGKLDSDILSQCMTQIIMKIINPSDQDNIKQSVEAVTADLLNELPSLTTGQAVVVGSAINTPVTIRVRERFTRPGGSGSNAPREWKEYQEVQGTRNNRETSPMIQSRDKELF